MRLTFLVLLFLLSFSGTPVAQEQCRSVFQDGIALSEGIFTKKNQTDPAMIADLTARILAMAQSTLAESITPKITLEKNGKLTLGVMLKEGFSLEAEYAQDARVATVIELDAVYHLVELSIVRPNGEKIRITRSPTSLYGDTFSKSHISRQEILGLEDSAVFENLSEVQIPLAIEGLLWRSVAEWIPRLEYFNREELRKLDPEHLTRSKATAFVREKMQDAKKIINKQSIKYIIFGILIYLYTERNHINFDFLLSDPWPKLAQESNSVKLHAEEGDHLKEVLNGLLKSDVSDAAIFQVFPQKTRYSEILYHSLPEITEILRALSAVEKRAGSKQHVYVFKNDKITPFSPKNISQLLGTDTEKKAVILFHYPAHKRVWLISANQVIEGGHDDLRYFGFALDGVSKPEIYKMINARLSPGERTLQ